MLALAVVFGVILVSSSHVFSVEKDAKAQEIEELLAKSNCGGCGKAGCAQFAEALVKGEANLSDCKATPRRTRKRSPNFWAAATWAKKPSRWCTATAATRALTNTIITVTETVSRAN